MNLKKRKIFDLSFLKFFNKRFWIGLLVGLTIVVSLVAYHKEPRLFVVNPQGVEEKAEQLGAFLEDYQTTLRENARQSGDDVDKLLCFRLYKATSLYTKRMTQCFDEAFKMKNPDITQDHLKNFLDGLKKEREKDKIKI